MATSATVELSNSIVFGSDCSFKLGETAFPGITSVSVSYSAESQDVTTRDDNGWTRAVPGKKSVKLDLSYIQYKNDATQALILQALQSKQGLNVEISGGAASIAGVFTVSDVSEPQEDGPVTMSATLNSYGAITVTAPESSTV